LPAKDRDDPRIPGEHEREDEKHDQLVSPDQLSEFSPVNQRLGQRPGLDREFVIHGNHLMRRKRPVDSGTFALAARDLSRKVIS
jgi:hypothetical protein